MAENGRSRLVRDTILGFREALKRKSLSGHHCD
jgi:hypothetical protein